MFVLSSVLALHDEIINRYGGSHGVRDAEALDGALARPFQTFGGEELYKDVYKQSAAILESIIMNHPFVDGNKPTDFALMFGILLDTGLNLTSTEDENYNSWLTLLLVRSDLRRPWNG